MGALLLTLLLTQSAAFGGHRARILPVRHRVSPPVACANEDLISKMCAYEADEERRAAMEAVFAEWPAGSHDSKGDEVVAAISKRIGETQTAALAAHGRGEDTVGRLSKVRPGCPLLLPQFASLPLGAGPGPGWLYAAQGPMRCRSANVSLDKKSRSTGGSRGAAEQDGRLGGAD